MAILTDEIPQPAFSRRAQELFDQQHSRICRETDRLFVVIMLLQWAAGIFVALVVSPQTWIGATPHAHLHVWAALFLGGAISSLPVYLAIRQPGRPLTRHVIAFAQLSWSALLIHLSGGRIETHFHVFGSLAFLAFYRDWRVLITGTVVVATDHFVRGVWWPQSVYGILLESPYRFVEHAGWVVFEVFFLVRSCRRSTAEMHALSQRQAQLEATNDIIEGEVAVRTYEIVLSQRKLQSSEARLKAMFASARDPMITINGHGIVQSASSSVDRVLGWKPEELIGRNINVLMPEPYRSEHPGYLARYRKTGESSVFGQTLELTAVRKDGTPFPCEVIMWPVELPEQQEMLFMGSIRDITARKQSELELRRFRAALDCSADAVFLVDRSRMRFVDMNQTACDSLGYERAELLTMGPPDIVENLSIETVDQEFDRLLQSADATGKIEAIHVRKDGLTFPVEVFLTPIDDDSRLFLGSARDITERKRNEEAMRAMNLRLQQKQRLETVGTLAGGIAHEFNNLLQTIRGYTSFAMKGLDPAEQRHQDLVEVIKASERASNLTQQMLGFGRQKAATPENFSPNDLVDELLEILRPVIGEDIQVQTLIDDDMGTLHADRTLVQQMLMNLCVNARDAMPDGGELTIRTRNVVLNAMQASIHPDAQPGRYAQFSVSDTGIGMASEVVEHIFDPFFTTKEVGQGTGLGLSLAYGIVKQHDGFIYAYSEPDRGTVFKVYLPVIDGPADDEAAFTPDAAGGTETILVAEDDRTVREVTVRALTDAGYDVLIAMNGKEAVELFQRNAARISLVLLDVVMPKMGGREAQQAIHRLQPDVPVVFYTGYDPETAAGQIADSTIPMLEKPIDPDTLLLIVRATLDQEALCLAT